MKVHTQRIFILSFIFSQERIFQMLIGPTFARFGLVLGIWSIWVGFENSVHYGPIYGSVLGIWTI